MLPPTILGDPVTAYCSFGLGISNTIAVGWTSFTKDKQIYGQVDFPSCNILYDAFRGLSGARCSRENNDTSINFTFDASLAGKLNGSLFRCMDTRDPSHGSPYVKIDVLGKSASTVQCSS